MTRRLLAACLLAVVLGACNANTEPATTPTGETTTSLPTTTSTSGATTSTTILSCAAPADSQNPRPPTTDPEQEPTGNRAPSVAIVAPDHLSRHQMELNDEGTCFEVAVELAAESSDPEGDTLTIEWFSSDEGFLGTGPELTATLHTIRSDVAHPVITARATDEWGAVAEAEIQILIWIPSDN